MIWKRVYFIFIENIGHVPAFARLIAVVANDFNSSDNLSDQEFSYPDFHKCVIFFVDILIFLLWRKMLQLSKGEVYKEASR